MSYCLKEGTLGQGTANEILTNIAVAAPVINANGGFDAYMPVALMEPYHIYIIDLE